MLRRRSDVSAARSASAKRRAGSPAVTVGFALDSGDRELASLDAGGSAVLRDGYVGVPTGRGRSPRRIGIIEWSYDLAELVARRAGSVAARAVIRPF
jgi:hypothetical protein